MRKSTLFISAMLTVFMLVTLFGVVSAYQRAASSESKAAEATQPVVELQATEQVMSVAPSQTAVITPEQATTLAIQMIARTDVYSVESVMYEGTPAYLVTFSSGDLVYVSPAGQILAVTKLEPVVIVPARRNQDDGTGNQGGGSSGEHEGHDEHEGGDD